MEAGCFVPRLEGLVTACSVGVPLDSFRFFTARPGVGWSALAGVEVFSRTGSGLGAALRLGGFGREGSREGGVPCAIDVVCLVAERVTLGDMRI